MPDPEIALSAVAGGLIGLLRMCQRHPDRVTETTVDQLAEAELRLLGVPPAKPPASSPSRFLPSRRGDSRDNPASPRSQVSRTAMNRSKRQLSRYGWRPADPPRRPVLFINPRSGDGKAARARLAERTRDTGIEAVILAPGQDLATLAGEAAAAGADALGMAGGDGSLAVVAAAAAAHEIPFVCVPAGTRNHFDSKEQLFATASQEVLERWGQMIDRAITGITDPAELFAVGTRISGRLPAAPRPRHGDHSRPARRGRAALARGPRRRSRPPHRPPAPSH